MTSNEADKSNEGDKPNEALGTIGPEYWRGRRTLHKEAWKRKASLWQAAQTPTEKVADYVNRLLVKAEQLVIDNASILMIALNGLQPYIRNAVLQKDSKTLDELLQTVTLFEVASGTYPTGQEEILKVLITVQLQLERLSGPYMQFSTSRFQDRIIHC